MNVLKKSPPVDFGIAGYEVSPSLRQSQHKVQRVANYVLDHIDKPLPIEDLAQIFGYSERYFRGIFKTITGQSIGTYIQDMRMFKSLRILRNAHESSILQTALAVGYESHSAFTRTFKQRFGFSPSQFSENPFPVCLKYGGKPPQNLYKSAPFRVVKVSEWVAIGYLAKGSQYQNTKKNELKNFLIKSGHELQTLYPICTMYEDPRQYDHNDVTYFNGYLVDPWKLPYLEDDRFFFYYGEPETCAVFEHIGDTSMLWQLASRAVFSIESHPRYRYAFSRFHNLCGMTPGTTRVYVPIFED